MLFIHFVFLFRSVKKKKSGQDGRNNGQGMMGPPGQPGTPGQIGPKGKRKPDSHTNGDRNHQIVPN